MNVSVVYALLFLLVAKRTNNINSSIKRKSSLKYSHKTTMRIAFNGLNRMEYTHSFSQSQAYGISHIVCITMRQQSYSTNTNTLQIAEKDLFVCALT